MNFSTFHKSWGEIANKLEISNLSYFERTWADLAEDSDQEIPPIDDKCDVKRKVAFRKTNGNKNISFDDLLTDYQQRRRGVNIKQQEVKDYKKVVKQTWESKVFVASESNVLKHTNPPIISNTQQIVNQNHDFVIVIAQNFKETCRVSDKSTKLAESKSDKSKLENLKSDKSKSENLKSDKSKSAKAKSEKAKSEKAKCGELLSPLSVQPTLPISVESLSPSVNAIKPKISPPQRSTEERRQSQRQKQIDFGKKTPEYQQYIAFVPKEKRKWDDPKTPDREQICSKRSWDGQVKQWRRRLHKYDVSDEL